MLNVFKFSFLQQLKTKSYYTATLVMSVLLFIFVAGAFVLVQVTDKEDVKPDIDHVYICDLSSLKGSDYNIMHKYGKELCKDVEFIPFENGIKEACIKAAEESGHVVAAEITGNEAEGFKIKVVEPEGYDGDKKSVSTVASYMEDNFKYVLFEQKEFSEEIINEINKETIVVNAVEGDENSSDNMMKTIQMILPVFGGVMLYMLSCIYGQNIARQVVIEKDSKMMETLLVMVKPYNIIYGKLFALWLFAICQVLIWFCAILLGMVAGIEITKSMTSSGNSVGEKFISVLSEFLETGIFNTTSVICALIAFAGGFLIFCALAALMGSFASKTEEVNAYYSMYAMVVVAGFMFSYMNSLSKNEHLLSMLRYIPVTSPFLVPSDVIAGSMSIAEALVSTVIMIAFATLIVFIAAKIYNLLVLYRGAAPKPKDVIRMLKNSK